MKPIVIVQHGAEAGPGHFERYLLQKSLPYQTVCVYAGDTIPSSAAPYGGICSLGGRMSANDDLPWIDDELALMCDADRRGVPIIGHCLGAQLLAKALGAPVTRSAMKEIGWSEVQVDNAELAREWIGNEPAFELFQWHGDVFDLPAGARRFLTSRLCTNQAFVVDRENHSHLGMQFHVEMTPQLVNAWLTDPIDAHELDEAFQRQGGTGVQRAEQIVLNVDERTRRMSKLADRIYQRWLCGVRS
jgi:GMP synthase-like glutamine amidotransferase